jgi:outer membrane lipoprotein-sorting protein
MAMKKEASFTVRNIICASMLCIGMPDARTQEAREIVSRADLHSRGKTSEAIMTIRIMRSGWSKEMKIRTWSKGNDYAMILVTAPAREKGTVFLKRFKEVWNWIPSIERNIKMPPSMMSQSWMGTDFTNDDLVKEASIVEDYMHTLAGDTSIDERPCHVISMTPLQGATVVWGKIRLCIDKAEPMILRAEYYDEEFRPVNIMTGSDIRMLGGRLLPSKMKMMPVGKKGNRTELIYENLRFDQPLENDFFRPDKMQHLQ